MTKFSLSDIERSFSPSILDRGRSYVRNGKLVRAWINQKGAAVATVGGSRGEMYEVSLTTVKRQQQPWIKSQCECTYSSQCKHGAALALYMLDHELTVEAEIDEEDDDGVGLLVSMQHESQEEGPELPLPKNVSDWLDRVDDSLSDSNEPISGAKGQIFYVLSIRRLTQGVEAPIIGVISRTFLQSGALGSATEIKVSVISSGNFPPIANAYDRSLLQDLDRNSSKVDWTKAEYRIDNEHGVRQLKRALASGRCVWHGAGGPVLREGPTRQGKLVWRESAADGLIRPGIEAEGATLLAMASPFYVDPDSKEVGEIDCGVPAHLVAALVRGVPFQPEHMHGVVSRLSKAGLAKEYLPQTTKHSVVRAAFPTPCLNIRLVTASRKTQFWSEHKITAPVAIAELSFEYEGNRPPKNGADIRVVRDGEIVIIRRNLRAEEAAKLPLTRFGWADPTYSGWDCPKGEGLTYAIVPPDEYRLQEPIERVNSFKEHVAPKLIQAGWKVQIEQNYRFVDDDEVEWDIGVDDSSGIDWFEFQTGIRVEGQPLDLKEVLGKLFAEQRLVHQGYAVGTKVPDDMYVFFHDGRTIKLSRKRLNSILEPLVELFGGVNEWPKDLKMPKSLFSETKRLEVSLEDAGMPWRTNDELRQLSDKLTTFDKLQASDEPDGFIGQLRGYQKEGLAWLNFLREYHFGGILADDMGLGKTIQVLAFIQSEKRAGRLDKPALIVAPTSTIPNWKREIEKFTPELSVVALQGVGRMHRFEELKSTDIALTTYPLLARDCDHLLQSSYSVLVLDEAQNVKNPNTGAARAARQLVARQRICMSGTPVENHLGELWSLFHFLMPSFLGGDSEFKRNFRTPIEKIGDQGARERLTRRIKPFMLRRTKEQVVKELPPKTEIIETVAFDDEQRDLYESIRVAMDSQVRSLIASQGFERSRFQILDALLKLRQVCCDPRLVKLSSARTVKSSAKLDRLIEMLTVLLEDGRSVLLFSQFTSMLNLIEARLKDSGIEWVRISGDTEDRDTPVRRFQDGAVKLFLISLKAGGTGLNLTAADTVILYDPWWNPAVENQAIDRAHRIGQDKAVMVYRLVAQGTIEEKMLEMQARKGDLARSVLSEDADAIKKLTADDLRWILS